MLLKSFKSFLLQPSSAGSPLLRRALSPDRLHPRSAEGKKVGLFSQFESHTVLPVQNLGFGTFSDSLAYHCKGENLGLVSKFGTLLGLFKDHFGTLSN